MIIKINEYKEYVDDINYIFNNFGGPAGRNKAETFDNLSLINRLNLYQNGKYKEPNVLYRGMALNDNYKKLNFNTFSDEQIINMSSGIRSWSKNKTSAMFYTWNNIVDPIRILFIWENPITFVSGNLLNKDAISMNLIQPLDDGEFITDTKDKVIITNKEVNYSKNVPLNIITLKTL